MVLSTNWQFRIHTRIYNCVFYTVLHTIQKPRAPPVHTRDPYFFHAANEKPTGICFGQKHTNSKLFLYLLLFSRSILKLVKIWAPNTEMTERVYSLFVPPLCESSLNILCFIWMAFICLAINSSRAGGFVCTLFFLAFSLHFASLEQWEKNW